MTQVGDEKFTPTCPDCGSVLVLEGRRLKCYNCGRVDSQDVREPDEEIDLAPSDNRDPFVILAELGIEEETSPLFNFISPLFGIAAILLTAWWVHLLYRMANYAVHR